MEIFRIGDYLKKAREDQKRTQEEVCEGICEAPTLSRLENNERAPAYNRLVALLQRLGLPDDRFYALLSPKETKIGALQKEITSASIWYVQREGEEKRQIREEGIAKLQELEQVAGSDDRLIEQFALSMRAIFGTQEGDYSPEEQLFMLMEAIRKTVPRFDLEEINRHLYSSNETQIINQIAIAYSKSGDHKKAVDIYSQLLKYAETHYQQITQSAGHLPLICSNYAIELGLCKRYEKAIKIAERGWEASIKYGYYLFLPELIHIVAECQYHLGNTKQSKTLYTQSYCVYQAVGDQHNLQILRSEAQKYLNLTFDF